MTTKPKVKTFFSGYIVGAVVCWLLSIYVFLTGDPTQILLYVRGSQGPRDSTEITGNLILFGIVLFGIGLWQRHKKQ
jgi:hypothetical protein